MGSSFPINQAQAHALDTNIKQISKDCPVVAKFLANYCIYY